ncbi:hypothetical protein GT94_01225 [Geobacillus stearothermophilus]|nr:hypothetical protein ET31_06155 [Geobacillus stearothermophilus]KFX36794.1 hypothetical protein GT94_01225 [Geobacillus stearothermophilus]KZM58473.1 hypothetical protein A3Q36_02680 [Geobacillus stearothermophilus]
MCGGEFVLHSFSHLLMKRTGDVGLAELVEPFSFPEKFVAISLGMLSKHVVDRLRDCSVNLRWRQVLLHPFLSKADMS